MQDRQFAKFVIPHDLGLLREIRVRVCLQVVHDEAVHGIKLAQHIGVLVLGVGIKEALVGRELPDVVVSVWVISLGVRLACRADAVDVWVNRLHAPQHLVEGVVLQHKHDYVLDWVCDRHRNSPPSGAFYVGVLPTAPAGFRILVGKHSTMKTALGAARMQSVAKQMMGGNTVKLGGKTLPVRRTSVQHLKTVTFKLGGREYQAIQQNPDRPSRWGKLARAGRLRQRWRQASPITFGA
jgi:hypothetical protein